MQTVDALVARAEDRILQLPLEDSQDAHTIANFIHDMVQDVSCDVALAAVHLALARLLARGHAERGAIIDGQQIVPKIVVAP